MDSRARALGRSASARQQSGADAAMLASAAQLADRAHECSHECLPVAGTDPRQWPPARRFRMLVHNLRRIMSNPRNVLVANYGYAVNYVRYAPPRAARRAPSPAPSLDSPPAASVPRLRVLPTPPGGTRTGTPAHSWSAAAALSAEPLRWGQGASKQTNQYQDPAKWRQLAATVISRVSLDDMLRAACCGLR